MGGERLSLWKEFFGGAGWKRLRLVLKFWTAGCAMMALWCWTAVGLALLFGSEGGDIGLFVWVAIGASLASVVCWRLAFR
jgi:hypothetical protein